MSLAVAIFGACGREPAVIDLESLLGQLAVDVFALQFVDAELRASDGGGLDLGVAARLHVSAGIGEDIVVEQVAQVHLEGLARL